MARFGIKTQIFFGKDATDQSIKAIKNRDINSAVIIADACFKENTVFSGIISKCKENGLELLKTVFSSVNAEPSYNDLDSFTEQFRDYTPDAIVALGGGSVLDLAKGVAVLLKNSGKGIDYRGMNKVHNPSVPVICFPSTAGTGSEVTHTASFVDTVSKKKLGINGKNVAPFMGVLVPELTFSCPRKVTLYSGLDAMLHAIEAVTAKTTTQITQLLGTKAFSLLFSNFEKALSTPNDFDARESMLMGSYLAGVAMMNAGGGPASGISYPLGVYYDVPHGLAGGIFLPHVFAFNVSKGYIGYNPVFDAIKPNNTCTNDREKAEKFVTAFSAFYRQICAPARLSDAGFHNVDVDQLTRLTMEQRVENLELNPVPFKEQDVLKMCKAIK